MSDDTPDCQECGACCLADYDSPEYVHMTEAEANIFVLAGHGEKVYRDKRSKSFGEPLPSVKTCYDRRGNCKCVALEGELGGKVRCTVYDIRPSVCRNFKPGSAVCYEARRAAGMVGSDR